MLISTQNISIEKINESYHITSFGDHWQTLDQGPVIIAEDGTRYMPQCLQSEYYDTGCSKGMICHYPTFLTYVYIEEATDHVYFSLIPIQDLSFKEILWPAPIEFSGSDGKTVLPYMQGLLIPNTYSYDYRELAFDGQFASNCAYMPFWAQYANAGYVMINQTYWDCKYAIDHDHTLAKTNIYLRWLPSLGKIAYARKIKMVFSKKLDHVKAAKIYRSYAQECGIFTSLQAKMLKLPKIQNLIGAQFIHFGIKTHIDQSSALFGKIQDHLTTFKQRQDQYEKLRLKDHHYYLHLDGWGEPGYDNAHPDYLPPCVAAGGWEGLKQLIDAVSANGDLIGLHDQYRDYYQQAATYDIKNALEDIHHDHYQHARWAGGKQNYLCAALAKDYVKRNFTSLFAHGIRPQASYLDVFTCNELDECANLLHPMTRKECAAYRNSCFDYLTSQNIISSSEECNDYAISSLVFAHYGPYEFMLKDPSDPQRMGIPIPLFNLVYHDCFILPWPMEKHDEDYMLYALLNGGAPYLIREGAYPNTDGAFDQGNISNKKHQERCDIVSRLHEKVALAEMIDHQLLDHKGKRQKAIFANGISVTINLDDNTYQILENPKNN